MEFTLGISVYPDIRSLNEIKTYIKLASKYGVRRVFSSMFSVEGTRDEVLDYFRGLIDYSHKYGMEVDLDVNPMLFEKLGATYRDLSVFKSIGVDILRMDFSYGGEKDAILINNEYGIKIEFNSSAKIVGDLIENDIGEDSIMVCHNFYPQRYTGLAWKKFVDINKEIKSIGNVEIGAFISSQASDSHGVWGAKHGLPTVESLRDLAIDLQARILLATGNVNSLLIGNAYATEDEFKKLSELMSKKQDNKENEILSMLLEYKVINLNDFNTLMVRPNINDDISENEADIIYNFSPHLSMGDNSEWMWRSRMPRFKYSKDKYKIPFRKSEKKYFEYGDIVIVNDNYKHYAGEVQIVLKRMENDGDRNLVGCISGDELKILDQLKDFTIVEFLADYNIS